jgi:hypothetical protein
VRDEGRREVLRAEEEAARWKHERGLEVVISFHF